MIKMPEPKKAVLDRRAEIVQALRRIVPGEGVIDSENELRAYECDGLTAYRQLPMVVVLPETTMQVAEVLRYCSANKINVVPRGAGTSLSGGALPLQDGVLLAMGKFKKILEIDTASSEWKDRIAKSKFRTFPEFGAANPGPILLQDHNNEIWFRNIAIRPLPGS